MPSDPDVRQEAERLLAVADDLALTDGGSGITDFEVSACLRAMLALLASQQEEIERLTNQALHDDDAYTEAVRLKSEVESALAAALAEVERLKAALQDAQAAGRKVP